MGEEQHHTRGCKPLLGSVGVPTTHCSVCSILGPQPKLRQNETYFNILLQSFLPSIQCVCLLLHILLPRSRIDSLARLHGCSFPPPSSRTPTTPGSLALISSNLAATFPLLPFSCHRWPRKPTEHTQRHACFIKPFLLKLSTMMLCQAQPTGSFCSMEMIFVCLRCWSGPWGWRMVTQNLNFLVVIGFHLNRHAWPRTAMPSPTNQTAQPTSVHLKAELFLPRDYLLCLGFWFSERVSLCIPG